MTESLQLRILRVLATAEAASRTTPTQNDTLNTYNIAAMLFDISAAEIRETLCILTDHMQVTYSVLNEDLLCDRFAISKGGLTRLEIADGAKARGPEVRSTLAKVAEAQAQDEADDDDPPTAVICIDEDELDRWWASLDVEQKADAFAQFSLAMYQGISHIYIEPHAEHRIPVMGTVGEAAPREAIVTVYPQNKAAERAAQTWWRPGRRAAGRGR